MFDYEKIRWNFCKTFNKKCINIPLKKPSNEFALKVRKTVEVPEVSVCCGRTVSTGRVGQVCMSLTSFYKFR